MLTDTGRLLIIFIIGSVATVIGTLLAFKIFPMLNLGEDSWKVSETVSALSATSLWKYRDAPYAVM